MIPPTQRELSQEKLCSSSDYQQHLQFELQQTSSMDSKQVQGLTQDGLVAWPKIPAKDISFGPWTHPMEQFCNTSEKVEWTRKSAELSNQSKRCRNPVLPGSIKNILQNLQKKDSRDI